MEKFSEKMWNIVKKFRGSVENFNKNIKNSKPTLVKFWKFWMSFLKIIEKFFKKSSTLEDLKKTFRVFLKKEEIYAKVFRFLK